MYLYTICFMSLCIYKIVVPEGTDMKLLKNALKAQTDVFGTPNRHILKAVWNSEQVGQLEGIAGPYDATVTEHGPANLRL